MKDEIITKCICGKYHCPVCDNQMEVYAYEEKIKRLEAEVDKWEDRK
jgi:transcription initiation factor IIE alpha subunit